MKAEAQEGLGMVSSHISTHTHFSSLLLLRRSKLPKSLPTAGLAEQTVPSWSTLSCYISLSPTQSLNHHSFNPPEPSMPRSVGQIPCWGYGKRGSGFISSKHCTHTLCAGGTRLLLWPGWEHLLLLLFTVSFSDEWLVLQTLYVLSTFIFGFSIWADLRKRIQTARIDSVMKIQWFECSHVSIGHLGSKINTVRLQVYVLKTLFGNNMRFIWLWFFHAFANISYRAVLNDT